MESRGGRGGSYRGRDPGSQTICLPSGYLGKAPEPRTSNHLCGANCVAGMYRTQRFAGSSSALRG